MDDVEYILRIVLKARDDMAAVLAKARTQLKGFAGDADKMNTSLDKLNTSMGKFNTNMDGITKKLEAWRAVLRDAGDDSKDATKSLDSFGKAAAQTVKQTKDAAEATSRYRKQIDELGASFVKLNDDFDKGHVSRNEYVKDLQRIASEYDTLSKKSKVTTELARALRRGADEARRQAQVHIDADKAVAAAQKEKEAAIKKATEAEKKAAEAARAAITTQKDLQKQARAYRDEMRAIHKAHEDGVVSSKHAAAEYNRLGKELEKIALKMTEASRTKSPAHIWADESEAAVERIKNVNQQAVNDAKRRVSEERSLLDDITNAVQDHVKRREDIERGADADAQGRSEAATRRAKERTDATIAELLRNQAEQERIVRETAEEAERVEKQHADARQSILDRRKRQEEERNRLARESARIGEGGSPAEIRRLASEYDKLARQYRVGSARAREFGDEAERLRLRIRSSTSDTDRHGGALQRLSKMFTNAGSSAAGFDNQMRGIGILAAVGFMNQLISAAIALGGELVSLAGSAVMAGGALGGILAAGAAQALPVFGLLAGAINRVKGVFEAFGEQQDLQKAQFTDAQKGGEKAIDQANTLANAHDAVTEANERLAESRRDLNQAQADGVDQLEDLIYAEKSAALAARGASLNVKEAQLALSQAIAGGASALEIQGRQQALDAARLARGRTRTESSRARRDVRAAGGEVGNLESVQQAAKAVEDAEKAVVKANRALDQTLDKADRAAASTMTAAANLEYLLSKMSPAERRMLTAVTSFMDSYERIFVGKGDKDGIYGVIVDSFTRAVEKAEKIIEMPKVINAVQGLANEIGANIDKIVNAVDPKTLDQILRIIDQSGENMGPLVDMAIALAKAFLDISEAANPAFEKLIEYIEKLVGRFTDLTGDSDRLEDFFTEGEEHLESWLDLLVSVIELFAVLTGASADSGKRSIDDLTDKIKGWTDWIEDHREDVVGFFEDAREAAYDIGGVLEHIATALFGAFTPERVEDFAFILNEVLIPAFEEVMVTMGEVTDAIADFLEEHPLAADVAKWVVALSLLGTVAGAITGVFAKIIGPIARFVSWVSKASQGAGRLGIFLRAWGGLASKAIPFVGWAAAIAGVLHYFGLLDDAWDEIKQAAGALWGQLEPPIKRFMESFKGLIDAIKEGKGAFGVIMPILREFLEILVEVGGFILEGIAKAIGKVLGGIIDIVGGLIDILTGILTGDFGLIWDGVKKIVEGALRAIIGLFELVFFRGLGRVFTAGWAAVRGLFTKGGETLFNGIKGLFGRISGWVKGAWDDMWKFIGRFGNRVWEAAKDAVSFFWRGWRRIGQVIRDGVERAWGFIKALPGRLWDIAKEAVKMFGRGWVRIGTTMRSAIETAWNWIKGFPKRLGDLAVDAAGKFAAGFKNIGKAIVDAIAGGANKAGELAKTVVSGFFNLVNNGWNKFLGGRKFGFGPASFTLPKLNLHLAEGGPVPGVGSSDTVNAKLTPGEHVWTKDEVARAGGHGVMFALRALFGGGGQGGPFGYQAGGVPYGDLPSTASTATPQVIAQRAKAQRDQEKRERETDRRERAADLKLQREDYQRSGNQRAEDNRTMWNDILTTTRRAANDVEKQIRDMRVNTTKTFARTTKDITASWAGMWYNLMKVTHEGLHYIGHETNQALVAMGEERIHFKLSAPSAPKTSDTNLGGATTSTDRAPGGRFAPGGWVGRRGQRGRDRGGYALGDGEAVLAWQHQPYVETALNAQYGFGLGGLFNHVRGFHAGGKEQPGFAAGRPGGDLFDGKPSNVNSAVKALIRLMKEHFPRLIVTSTTNHGKFTTTGNISDHGGGNAVDMAASYDAAGIAYMKKAANWVLSSGLYKRLKQGIFNPILAVNAGQRQDPPGQFAGRTWAEHANHLHLAIVGALTGRYAGGAGGGGGEEIKRKIVTPRHTATAKLIQRGIDTIRRLANKKIEGVSGESTGTEAGPSVTASGASAAEKVFNFFTGHGLSEAIAAGFAGTFQKESNFSTSVTNARGSGATGLAQWLGDRLTKLKQKKNWQSLQTQLDYVWEELHGSESAAFSAIKTAKSPADAARIIDSRYERSDNILSAPAYAEAWYRRFAQGKAMGGPIDGPDGAPVPILAHAGEWVLNKGQQLRAALLSGLSVSGLKSMLGFHGGPTGFQGGGPVEERERASAARTNAMAAVKRAVAEAIAAAAKTEMITPIQTLKTLMDDVADTWKGLDEAARLMKKIRTGKGTDKQIGKKLSSAYKTTIEMLSNITGDQGIGAITQEIANRVTRSATRLKDDMFNLVGGKATRDPALDAMAVLKRELASMGRFTDDLVGKKSAISQALVRTNKLIKKVTNDEKLTEGQRRNRLAELAGVRNGLLSEQQTVDGEIADSIEARYNKQLEIDQLFLEAQKKAVEDINKKYERIQKGLELEKRFFAAIGNDEAITNINKQIQDSMAANVRELQDQLTRTVDPETRTDIEDQIKELNIQIHEMAHQAIREAADAVSKAADRERTRLSLFARMADATGVVGQAAAAVIPGMGQMSRAEIAKGRIAADVTEKEKLESERAKADAAGNIGLVKELTDKINELEVTIAENTKAAFDARIAQVSTTHDYKQSMLDLDMQLLDLDTTITGADNTQKKSDLLKQKGDDLVAKGNELTALLNESTPGTQTYLDLQKAIKENEVATKQNTVALNELSGAGNTPATYTSTAWQWFNRAVLTGTGDVMSQYDVSKHVSPYYTGGPGSTNSTNNSGNVYNTEVTVNEAGGPVDPNKIASGVVYAQSTAQH